MTSNEQDHDWHAAREEVLYHESARDLARMVTELEGELAESKTTIEGLGQTNTELEKEIQDHQTRYANAIRMIKSRQQALDLQRQAYQKLAVQYSKLAEAHVKLISAVNEVTHSVVALREVPIADLDNAIGVVANALDTAVLS